MNKREGLELSKPSNRPERGTGAESPGDRRQAIDLEGLLHWAYHRQRVRSYGAPDRALRPPSFSIDGVYQLMRRGRLGVRVDSTGPAPNRVHADALIVHGAVLGLGDLQAGLVIHHAETLSRPDWMPGAVPIVRPVLRGNGKPKMIYRQQAGSKSSRPSHCLIDIVLTPQRIESVRAEYEYWHRAVARLMAGDLADRLTAYRITGFAAPARPWLNQPVDSEGKT